MPTCIVVRLPFALHTTTVAICCPADKRAQSCSVLTDRQLEHFPEVYAGKRVHLRAHDASPGVHPIAVGSAVHSCLAHS